MRVTDQQVRKLMEEMAKHGGIGHAAMRAGMDRNTGRRYVALGRLPSEMKEDRDWRTRPDPIRSEDWAEVEGLLRDAPELEGKALFEYLCERTPGRYDPGQVRTLQRRIHAWRAHEGPGKEVFFPQRGRRPQPNDAEPTSCDGYVQHVLLGARAAGPRRTRYRSEAARAGSPRSQ